MSLRLPAAIAVFTLLVLPASALAAGKAVFRVFLDEEDKGDRQVIVTDDGKVLVSGEDLLEMGFEDLPEESESDQAGYVRLDAFSPPVQAKLDEKSATLRLTADPSLLKGSNVDLTYRDPTPVFHPRDSTAFLNYGVTYGAANDFGFSSLSLPLETGVSSNNYLGLSNFSYTKTDTGSRLVRLLTNVTRDDPEHLRRLVVGDISAFSGLLGSGGILGGVGFSKTFSMDPLFIRSPGLDIAGMATTPSDVEIYVNDMLVKKERFSPGQFELSNIPNANGAGDVTLVIRDAFGREERVTVPYYVTSMLLKPGLHEYSYNVGFERKDLGVRSFSYGGPSFVGFHNVGLTKRLTLGWRGEADKDVVNAGPTAALLVGHVGEVDASLALSGADRSFGHAFVASYLYAGRYLSGRVTVKELSIRYSNLSLAPDAARARLEGAVTIGFRNNTLGSFSVGYSAADWVGASDRKRAYFFYNRKLSRRTSLNVNASRTDADKTTYDIFAGVLFIFGGERSGNLGFAHQDGANGLGATFQKNAPAGPGIGYRVIAEGRDQHQDGSGGVNLSGGDAFLQYHGPYGNYSAETRRSFGSSTYSLSAAGGIALVEGSIYPARPITDGFALVKLGGDLEKVRVNHNNQVMGATDKKGTLLVPSLVSYHNNSLSIDERDVPVNYGITEMRKLVSIPLRGGGVVKFDLQKTQGFVGRLFLLQGGKKVAAEYWGLEVQAGEKAIQSIVGKKGEFYLENVPSGRFPARLFAKDKECRFEMAFPETEEVMVDMGEVTCEMH